MQENNKLLLFSSLCKKGNRTETQHYELSHPLSFFFPSNFRILISFSHEIWTDISKIIFFTNSS